MMASLPDDRINSAAIIDISNLLFENLQRQADHVAAAAAAAGRSDSDLPLEVSSSPQVFLQVLRNCSTMMQFLGFDPSLVVEKCQILTGVLRMLCLCLCPPYSHSHLHHPSPNPQNVGRLDSSFGPMLEIFIHEFLMHQQLRKRFILRDYVSATSEKLSVYHHSHDDINTILVLVSSHFLLSVHDEWAFSRFIHSVSWSIEVHNEIPEISLSAALELLGTPVMFSAPYMLQAHLILLASRCIGIHMPIDDGKSDVAVVSHYIKAFEMSVKLYERYMSMLDLVDNVIGLEDKSSRSAVEVAFGSCIQPITCDKLNHQIDKLVSFCHPHSHDMLSGTKTDVVNNSIAFILANKLVIDEMGREEICVVLNYIISSIQPGQTERRALPKIEQRIQLEICLAGVLKLMSSSLLQIISHLKQNRCPVSMQDTLFCMISCFGKYRVSQPIQDVLSNFMGKHHRFEEMKQMLAHFASLLQCSFRRRLGFLWKGCIFMMMATMNLLVFEEGNLDSFGSLLCYAGEDSSLQISLPKSLKGLVHQRSSVIIASNMQNIQMLNSEDRVKFRTCENQWCADLCRNCKRPGHYARECPNVAVCNNCRLPGTDTLDSNKIEAPGGHRSGIASSTIPVTDSVRDRGSIAFFSCLPEYSSNPSEFDDLVDFVACTPGKDYSDWLKKRNRFRVWQHQKRAVAKRQQRKATALAQMRGSKVRSKAL